ncbi:hypothetical protein AB0L53_20205 [Nonomuraea sp. NPDC052129]
MVTERATHLTERTASGAAYLIDQPGGPLRGGPNPDRLDAALAAS